MPRLCIACVLVVLASPLLSLAAPAPTTAPAPTPTGGAVAAGGATASAPLAVPEPEDYLKDAHYNQYAQAAEEFLRARPDSPSAPRVALDLITTAAAYADQEAVNKMRLLLVGTYPTSVQARFLVGQMSEVAQFTSILTALADQNFATMPAGFARNYDYAIQLGYSRFGAAALGTGPGLVRTAIIAEIANDAPVFKAVVDQLGQSGAATDEYVKIFNSTTNATKPMLDRLAELHAMPDRAIAGPFEQYLLNQLPKSDRDSIAAEKIEADDLLDTGHLSEALPIMNKIASAPNGADARLLFWRAWASAATENIPVAKDDFAQLAKAFPNDPWGKLGAELSPAAISLDSSVSRTAEAALTAARGLKAGHDEMEGNLSYTRADGQKIDLYTGITSGKLLELVLKQGADVTLAYRATDADASLFFKGDTTISHFTKPALLPVPLVGIGRVGSDFAFGLNMKFSYSFDDLKTALDNLVASDFLSTREGLQDYLRAFSGHGIFPQPPAPGDAGSTLYTFVSPSVTSPTAKRVTFIVGSSGAITGIRTANFVLSDLHYGASGAVKVTPQPLPPLTAAEKGNMDMPALQKALTAFITTFSPPPAPVTPAATQPTPSAAASAGK